MKVICDRGALVDSLTLVSGVVASRTPKPVLTCVKLSAEDGALTLSATDLEVAVRVTTPRVEVQQSGSSLVPADKLNQIVRESVEPTLTLEQEEDTTHIRGQDSHFKLLGYPVGEFPATPQFTGNADFEVPAGEMNQLINQTVFATARENSRYAINGVLLERDGNKLNVVATDGRRLAMAKGTCKAGSAGTHSAIVPTRALNLLQRLLNDPEQTVRVRIAENQVLFATDTATLSSSLVEGSFPPYKDVIPRDSDKKAVVGTDILASAVRRAALLTSEDSKGVRLSFTSGDGAALTLTSRAPEMGEAEVRVQLEKFEGEALDIGFNPQYILDVLKVIQSDQVQFDFKAPNKPGIIRSGPNYLYVVMPVSLQG